MTAAPFAPPLVDARPPSRPGIGRLTVVEMRKMIDTRAGRWLTGITVFLSVVVVGIASLVPSSQDGGFTGFFEIALYPVNVLLPVLGILIVTSEWSQRTALTTFSLVPERQRVVAAKLLAAGAYAVLSLIVTLGCAAAGTATVRALGREGTWGFELSTLGTAALLQLLAVIMGVGFGLLLMNSPLAIVLYFALPTALSIVVSLIPSIEEAAGWVNLNAGFEQLAEDQMTSSLWTRLGTAATVWILLPIVLGSIRLVRRELK
jgi:ABC-2 type transport system permease protein